MSAAARETTEPGTLRIAVAFASIYLVWGSTYLAIRYAIETLPSFLMAGARFLIAGGILYAWARRFAPAPTRPQLRSAIIVGALLLVGGNGGVVWAEQRVPSGITALLVATVPLWIALLEWFRPGGVRPTLFGAAGLLMGLAGIVLLAGPHSPAVGERVDLVGTFVLLFATLSWSVGSLYSRGAPAAAPQLNTAMQMLAGGVLLGLLGTLTGEWSRVHLSAVSLRSALALLYLIVAGSLIGFSAYIWLLRVVSPSRVATYAYVNPVVAMFLGWLLAGEPFTARSALAAAVIVTAVVLITRQPDRRKLGVESEAARSAPVGSELAACGSE